VGVVDDRSVRAPPRDVVETVADVSFVLPTDSLQTSRRALLVEGRGFLRRAPLIQPREETDHPAAVTDHRLSQIRQFHGVLARFHEGGRLGRLNDSGAASTPGRLRRVGDKCVVDGAARPFRVYQNRRGGARQAGEFDVELGVREEADPGCAE
jgi:hypothetical protein